MNLQVPSSNCRELCWTPIRKFLTVACWCCELSLASVLPLSLTSSEMEEVEKNKKQHSQSDLTLQMIKK
jgi:hypothetical protein